MITRSELSKLHHFHSSPYQNHYYLLDYQIHRKFIINLKYRLNLTSTKCLTNKIAELLPEQLYQDFPLETDWLIVPVKLYWLSRYKRRFDLNEIIAKRLGSKLNNIQYLSAIKNVKSSTQGNCYNKSDRIANAKNKFRLKKLATNKLQGSNVIIFDDVVASGSTMRVCEKLLFTAGAKNVIWLSLAH